VTLTEEERGELESVMQKGGKGNRIKHAEVLQKLNKCLENRKWGYKKIMEAYGVSHGMIVYTSKHGSWLDMAEVNARIRLSKLYPPLV